MKVASTPTYLPLVTTEYDEYNRPSVKTYGSLYNDRGFLAEVQTAYDTLDNITEIKYNNDDTKRICYGYSTDNKLSQVIDYFEGTTTQYIYDMADRVVAIRKFDATELKAFVNLASELHYTYDGQNHLTGIRSYTPQLGVQETTYRYGNIAAGEMPDQVYGVSIDGVEKQSYTYDGLGRATNRKVTTTSNTELNNAYTYTYDANGNVSQEVFSPTAAVTDAAEKINSSLYSVCCETRVFCFTIQADSLI